VRTSAALGFANPLYLILGLVAFWSSRRCFKLLSEPWDPTRFPRWFIVSCGIAGYLAGTGLCIRSLIPESA
jgi:hypothetical protein